VSEAAVTALESDEVVTVTHRAERSPCIWRACSVRYPAAEAAAPAPVETFPVSGGAVLVAKITVLYWYDND
jgi:hypothetical protein